MENEIAPEAEKAIANPLAGKTFQIDGVVHPREKLSPEINALIDEFITIQKQADQATELSMKLRGIEGYIVGKIKEAIKKGG